MNWVENINQHYWYNYKTSLWQVYKFVFEKFSYEQPCTTLTLISAHTYLIFIAAIDYEAILQRNYSIMWSCDHSNIKTQFLTDINRI